MMHGHEKSSYAIVAVKPTNKVARPAAEQSAAEPAAAELVEPRAEAKGKVGQQRTHRAQYRVRVAQTLARIRQAIAVVTRGGNRMRESCKYGSVRGAPSNGRPYRDRTESTMFAGPSALIWPWGRCAALPQIGKVVSMRRLNQYALSSTCGLPWVQITPS